MSAEVERVARAISPDWDRLSRNSRENARITARVAIEEVRSGIMALLFKVRDKEGRSLDWCNACNEIAAKIKGER